MNIKPIRTPEDHAWALKEIEALWDKVEPGTVDGDRFEVLSTLVEAYEREHFPIPAPDPIATISFRLEQQGLTSSALLPVLRTTARVSEILNRRRALSLNMMRVGALGHHDPDGCKDKAAPIAIPSECSRRRSSAPM